MFQKPFIELIITYFIFIVIALTIYLVAYYIIVFNKYFDGIDKNSLKTSKFIKQIITNIIIIVIAISLLTFIKTSDILFKTFLTIEDSSGIEMELQGAGLTDATIGVWGYRVFAVVMILAMILAIRFFKKGNGKKTIISLCVIPAYLFILFLVMSIFQAVFVNTNKLDKEKQFISYNITNTKNAYNINIEEKEIENSGTITLEDVDNNRDILDNIVIVSKDAVLKTLEQYQTNVGYYSYTGANIANYNNSLVYVSPREIIGSGERTYENKTYEYTHGYGAIITSATETNEEGQVEYIQSGFVDENSPIKITEPRIYFGLETNDTIIVNSNKGQEYDYPINSYTNAEYSYTGTAGLNLNFLDRLILGIKNGDLNLAFSGSSNSESRIITNRNIIQRAKKVMPYLLYDEEPYLVVTDEGNLMWVLDAYTTSNSYPYSQSTTIEIDGQKSKINYIRNSVKVIIDAFNGDLSFYITDRNDPIAMSYAKVYPTLFKEKEETIQEDIQKHIVYPEFLYNIQSEMLSRYHNVQPEVLYRNDDIWSIAKSKVNTNTRNKMSAYYTMVKDENENKVGLIIPYTPLNRQNIVSYLVGTYNGENKLVLYKFSSGSNVLGPIQLDTQIEQDETISKELNDLKDTGTRLTRNMIVVPIENTLLYVETVYQEFLNEVEDESQIPVLKKIIVASGNKVAIGNNLNEALDNLLSQYAVKIEVEDEETEEGLIEAIIRANNNLQESSSNQNWEMIGRDLQRLQELIQKLEVLKQEELEQENMEQNNSQNILNNEIINNPVIE